MSDSIRPKPAWAIRRRAESSLRKRLASMGVSSKGVEGQQLVDLAVASGVPSDYDYSKVLCGLRVER